MSNGGLAIVIYHFSVSDEAENTNKNLNLRELLNKMIN